MYSQQKSLKELQTKLCLFVGLPGSVLVMGDPIEVFAAVRPKVKGAPASVKTLK
jgi:hypothetical protein